MERLAFVLDGNVPVNAVVIEDGKNGDDWLQQNPDAVEVTGLDPMPTVGGQWTFENNSWVHPPEPPLTKQDIEVIRMSKYIETSDPIFFKWQRGTASEQDWLNAVRAVKDAHPYPETV